MKIHNNLFYMVHDSYTYTFTLTNNSNVNMFTDREVFFKLEHSSSSEKS